MRIECPQCGASGNIDLSKRPPNVHSLRCRQCQARIPLPAEEGPPSVATQPERSPQIAPKIAAPPSEPLSAPPSETFPSAACSLCHQSFPRNEMVRFGQQWVCADCKPSYVDMLQQGIGKTVEFHYGGFWIRFGAKFLDGLVLFLVLFAIDLILGFIWGALFGAKGMHGSYIVLRILFQLGLPAVYTAFFLTKFRATPGKMACGLEVVTPEGETLSVGRAVGRHFSEWLSSIFLIGYIMAGPDGEKRALHDRICATRVVYR